MAENSTDSYRVQRCCYFSRNYKALEVKEYWHYVCSFLLASLKLMLLATGTQRTWSSELVQSAFLVLKDEDQEKYLMARTAVSFGAVLAS